MTTLTVHKDNLAQGCRSMAVAVAVLFGLTALAHCNSGCALFSDQGPKTVEQAYTAEIVACAATAGYPGAYDHTSDLVCRAQVNCRYGVGPCQ